MKICDSKAESGNPGLGSKPRIILRGLAGLHTRMIERGRDLMCSFLKSSYTWDSSQDISQIPGGFLVPGCHHANMK